MIVYAGSDRRQLRAFTGAVIVTPLGTARFVPADNIVNDRLVVEEMNVLTDVVTLRVTGRTDCHVASLLAMTW